MFSLKKKFEQWMSAVAFAEADEPEKALELIGVSAKRKERFSLDKIMAAITFAEAGEHEVARQYLDAKPEPALADTLGIRGVKVWYGSFALEPAPIPGVKVWFGRVATA